LRLLPESDLFQARLVNTYWNYMSVPFLRKCGREISFNRDKHWTNAKNFDVSDMILMTARIKSVPWSFPCTKFDLGTSVLQRMDEPAVVDFFDACAPFMTSLTIRDDWNDAIFCNNISSGLRFLQLKTLVLQLTQSTEYANSFFRLVEIIIAAAPTLTHVNFINRTGPEEYLASFISLLKNNVRNITSLRIQSETLDSHLVELASVGFRLKYFYFDFSGSRLETEPLFKFFESQTDSLQRLVIGDEAMCSLCTVLFPLMNELRSITIVGSTLGQISLTFPHIDYQKNFPKLERLWFRDCYGEFVEFIHDNMRPSYSLQILKLTDFADSNLIFKAAALFPRLKKLEVPCMTSVIYATYDSFPNLEELVINTRFVSVIDDLISGIPARQCREIMDKELYLQGRDVISRFQVLPYSILSLKSELFELFNVQYTETKI